MLKNRQLVLTLGFIITTTLILISSCRKINEATELGGDLIPPVDNINTFDTIIEVQAFNDLFTLGGPSVDTLKEDSTRSHYSYEQFLGVINNDPLFGRTDAQMFFELKPQNFPFKFNNAPDSLVLDSVVLVLDYLETYGDSSVQQTVTVSEITSNFRVDTSYLVRKNSDITVGMQLGSRTFIPKSLNDSVKAFKDTTDRQFRIKLDNSFGDRLLHYDTTSATSMYTSDSLFKSNFKGFALRSTGTGNAVMGFDLQGVKTKLAIYYHGLPGVTTDTAVDYFVFKPGASYFLQGSAAHNYINRDYAGFPIAAAQGGTTPDASIFIQNTPGSFARIKIPGLVGLSNRVVHRAELIAEQEYDPLGSDTIFRAPQYLYLDAYSPALGRYRNIPYDVIYDGASDAYNLGSFGAAPINALDGSGRVIKTWHFNLTRYVQHIVNNTEPVMDLRLFAPLYTIDQYLVPAPNATAVVNPPIVYVNPNMVKGRVRLFGGAPATSSPHRMRLRIVYSKI